MCDAEVRSRKGPTRWTSCKRSGIAVTIVTTTGSVLHYCERHADRVDDPERLHHMPVVHTTYHRRRDRMTRRVKTIEPATIAVMGAAMKVRIMSRHPISNPDGPTCWDGKAHECDVNLLDVAALGKWLTSKVRIKFCYDPGYSRISEGKAVFFTRRYTTGMHCMWVEKED